MDRVPPSEESFELVDRTGFQLDDRLIEDLELIPLDGVSEIGLDLQQVHVAAVHLTVEHLVTSFARLLSTVHSSVGVA